MASSTNLQRDPSHQSLSKSRAAIDRFPLREQTRLLHEFEETETRLSAIEQAGAEARLALLHHTVECMSRGVHPQKACVDLSKITRSFNRVRDQLKERLGQSERDLT